MAIPCLRLLNAGITGVGHQTRYNFIFFFIVDLSSSISLPFPLATCHRLKRSPWLYFFLWCQVGNLKCSPISNPKICKPCSLAAKDLSSLNSLPLSQNKKAINYLRGWGRRILSLRPICATNQDLGSRRVALLVYTMPTVLIFQPNFVEESLLFCKETV